MLAKLFTFLLRLLLTIIARHKMESVTGVERGFQNSISRLLSLVFIFIFYLLVFFVFICDSGHIGYTYMLNVINFLVDSLTASCALFESIIT